MHVRGSGGRVCLHLYRHGKVQVRGDRNPVGLVVSDAVWGHRHVPAHGVTPCGISVGLDLEEPPAAVLHKLPDRSFFCHSMRDDPEIAFVDLVVATRPVDS